MDADNFTPDAVRSLDGPPWLQERRLAALEAAAALPEPSTSLEEWRYGRIDELDLSRFSAEVAPAGGVPPLAATVRSELGELAGYVVLRNGRVVAEQLDAAVAAQGVSFGSVATVGDPARSVIGAGSPAPVDRFAAFNEALTAEPVVLEVPAGVTVDRPVAVISILDAGGAGATVFSRLSVHAGENSDVSVLEVSLSDDVEALVVPVTEIAVDRAARVRHSAAQDLGQRVWQVGSLAGRVDADATLSSAVAALGGDYARLRLDCTLAGRGATGNLASVYFAENDQTLDLRTFQVHEAADTTSNLLFKGAVAGRSHSVYTGMIRILPGGRGSNAFQTNRNLKLSPDAWAESVPNLEIENNDVRCSHASTVGPVDPDQRFYLESRGVPTEIADRLIVAGFFDEVLDDLPVPALAAPVKERINSLLDRLIGVELAAAGGSS